MAAGSMAARSMAARKHMRAERIKYPMGAVTAERALIYDEIMSG